MFREIESIWDAIVNCGVATNEELELVTSINGYNIDTLNDVIYCRTGYRDINQYLGNEDEEQRRLSTTV